MTGRWFGRAGAGAVAAAMIVAAAAIGGASAAPPATTVVFVDADAPPGGDGRSWSTAFSDLKPALAVARAGSGPRQVWVAEGVYVVDVAAGGFSAPFNLVAGVGIFGGFAGDESQLAQRDVVANPTVLDGAGRFTVVWNYSGIGRDAVLDGFALTGGAAQNGGGLYCYDCSPTLRNLVVRDNVAVEDGGGIYVYAGRPTIDNVTVVANVADGSGGGLYTNDGDVTIKRSQFEANTATDGAGYFAYGGSTRLTDVTFRANAASGGAGGVYRYEADDRLDRVTFDANTAQQGAGGYSAFEGRGTITNSLFAGNRAIDQFGGGAITARAALTIVNSTFVDNRAFLGGGGLWDSDPSAGPTLVVNSIFAANTAASGAQVLGTVTASSSIIQGGYPGTRILDVDPRFANPSRGNYRLAPGSAAIDAGDNAAAQGLTRDLGGGQRFRDDPRTPDTGIGSPPVVDLGAYEFRPR